MLLQSVAARLRAALHERSDYVLSRFGGDEFMMLIPDVSGSAEAKDFVERVVRAVSAPMKLQQHDVLVTPSVGIAIYPDSGKNADTLFKNADLAMFFSKRQGPGISTLFDLAMNTSALKRLTIEENLRNAVSNGELTLVFQPQFNLNNGCLDGLEALLRWRSIELEMVPVAEFIQVAEESGLIFSIGEWVLRAACSQAKAWLDAGMLLKRMAVNVSGRQLSQRQFPTLVRDILRETGLPAAVLEIEITETAIMDNDTWSNQVLAELRAIGVAIAIDDFGTGFSSFSRLREFPIDRLKIDRSFICNAHNSSDDRAIVVAIIAMAKTLQIEVVAEGVEEIAQMMLLQDEECTSAQGYLLGMPLPASETLQLLNRIRLSSDSSRSQRLLRLVLPSAVA